MEKVLNRGLTFLILTLKLDITQILTDFRRFERTMVWVEFWHGREQNEIYKPPIFKQKSTIFRENINLHVVSKIIWLLLSQK